jgi:surface carbohydrate biosynthesis protein
MKSLFRYLSTVGRFRLLDLYIEEFIKQAKPTLIGTNLDIDARFWTLGGGKFPEAKTFFVQHGILDGSIVNETYLSSSIKKVDYKFTFNQFYSKYFVENFELLGESIPIGSLKNNASLGGKSNHNLGDELFVISEWEPNTPEKELNIFHFLIRLFHNFCIKNGLNLIILPRFRLNDKEFVAEKEFYESIELVALKVAEKYTDLGNYNLTRGGFGVVFFFSTLGYELGARGEIPIVCISYGAKFESNPNRIFGWLGRIPQTTKGVCTDLTEQAIMKTLHDLYSGGISQDLFRLICVVDPENRVFKNFLKSELT